MRNKETKIIFIIVITLMLLLNVWVITANADNMNNSMKSGVLDTAELNNTVDTNFEPLTPTGAKTLMEPPIYEEPVGKSILCSEDKYMTYTNIDSVNINWDYIEVDKENLTYRNGVVREQPSGAILVAMGNEYTQGEYYEVHLSKYNDNDYNEIYVVKNVDLKSNIHTNRTNCYTTYDNANSIIEPWVTDEFEYLWAGNSRQLSIYIEDIREPWYEIWGE